jgi:hypothetical protein
MTIVAASPDPPWTLRIVNTGDQPIRIAADTRLLTFELDTGDKRGKKVQCAAPASLRPSSFPTSRELLLGPGQAYVEDFDPRLFCFGDKIDLLKGGTTVRAHLGWSKAGPKQPFAAQGTDRPEAFAGAHELTAPSILLSYASFAPMAPGVGKPAPGEAAAAPSDVGPTAKGTARREDGPQQADSAAKRWGEKPRAKDAPAPGEKASGRVGFGYDPKALKGGDDDDDDNPIVDRNAAHVDVYVDRTTDAESSRDAVITIRAVNEGRRDLTTALRGRMLSFGVERLGPDNKATVEYDCRGGDRPHAMPIETTQDLGAGQGTSIPIVLYEICPRETFERPGLYRVRPRIDTSVEGELMKRSPYLGKALAAQAALLRLATGRRPYQDEAPKPYTPPEKPAAPPADDDDTPDDVPTN